MDSAQPFLSSDRGRDAPYDGKMLFFLKKTRKNLKFDILELL